MKVRGRGRVAVLAVVVGLALLGGGASAADADSIALSVSPTPQTAQLPLTVTASGVESSMLDQDFVTYKPAGGTCAATPNQDGGTGVLVSTDTSADPNYASVNGPWAFTDDEPEDANGHVLALPAGSYLLCGWLTDDNANVVATTQLTFTVAPAQASLTQTGPPSTVATVSESMWTVDWSANSPSWLSVVLANPGRPSGFTCPARPSDIPSEDYPRWAYSPTGDGNDGVPAEVIGPGTVGDADTGTVSIDANVSAAGHLVLFGPYVECAWIYASTQENDIDASQQDDSQILVGPITTHFTVVPPGTPTAPAVSHAWTHARCRSTYTAWSKQHKHATRAQKKAEAAKLRSQHGCPASSL
jgi:hypothetical protein